MDMKFVGTIQDISHNGDILARGKFVPRIGTEVYAMNRRVGMIVNVFGPVSSPYITIRPRREKGETLAELIGSEIYIA